MHKVEKFETFEEVTEFMKKFFDHKVCTEHYAQQGLKVYKQRGVWKVTYMICGKLIG